MHFNSEVFGCIDFDPIWYKKNLLKAFIYYGADDRIRNDDFIPNHNVSYSLYL